jgi:uncharacterized protein YjeT (DUF2065 family)
MSDAQIFQVLSLAYLAIGIGILINPDVYKKLYEDFIENTSALYFGGIAALVIGYLLVIFHNVWEMDWHVIITIIGWMGLIKGILILVCPKTMTALTRAMIKKESTLKIMSVFVIIAGLLFSFLGFCPKSPI